MTDEPIDRDWTESQEGEPPEGGAGPPPPTSEGIGLPWRLLAALVLVALIVVFAIQNTQNVELRFLAWSWRLPLVIVVLVAVVASILLDQVLTGMVQRRRRLRRQEREELRRFRGEA